MPSPPAVDVFAPMVRLARCATPPAPLSSPPPAPAVAWFYMIESAFPEIVPVFQMPPPLAASLRAMLA
jgi:hypothetical protein